MNYHLVLHDWRERNRLTIAVPMATVYGIIQTQALPRKHDFGNFARTGTDKVSHYRAQRFLEMKTGEPTPKHGTGTRSFQRRVCASMFLE